MQHIQVTTRQLFRQAWARISGGSKNPTCGHCGLGSSNMRHIVVDSGDGTAYCTDECLDASTVACGGAACQHNKHGAAHVVGRIARPINHAERERLASLMPYRHKRENMATRERCYECVYLEERAATYGIPVEVVAASWLAVRGACEGCNDRIHLGTATERATARLDHNHLGQEIQRLLDAAVGHETGLSSALSLRGWLCNACNATAKAGANPQNTTGQIGTYLMNAGWYDADYTTYSSGLRGAHYLRECGFITHADMMNADYYEISIYDMMDSLSDPDMRLYVEACYIGRADGYGQPLAYRINMHTAAA